MPPVGQEYCDERVCLSASVCPQAYLRNYIYQIFVRARSTSHGRVLLWRLGNTIGSVCICGFMPRCTKQSRTGDVKKAYAQNDSIGGSTGPGRSLISTTALLLFRSVTTSSSNKTNFFLSNINTQKSARTFHEPIRAIAGSLTTMHISATASARINTESHRTNKYSIVTNKINAYQCN